MERRPNPPGWKQPKAPYNPYDPMDQRPAEGYPSEYKTPGKPRNWTMIPKQPDNYREVKETMKRLNYTPRPLSQLYPGQYKVLRRKGGQAFTTGVHLIAKGTTAVVLVVSVFFYRWNDGYDNVFSVPYRWQLRMRQRIFGNLSEQQIEDIKGKQRGAVKKVNQGTDGLAVGSSALPDESIALQRPSRSHVIAAERIMQEREEAILKAVGIAEAKLATNSSSSSSGSSSGGTSWWPFR